MLREEKITSTMIVAGAIILFGTALASEFGLLYMQRRACGRVVGLVICVLVHRVHLSIKNLDGHDPRLRTRRHQDAFPGRLPQGALARRQDGARRHPQDSVRSNRAGTGALTLTS